VGRWWAASEWAPRRHIGGNARAAASAAAIGEPPRLVSRGVTWLGGAGSVGAARCWYHAMRRVASPREGPYNKATTTRTRIRSSRVRVWIWRCVAREEEEGLGSSEGEANCSNRRPPVHGGTNESMDCVAWEAELEYPQLKQSSGMLLYSSHSFLFFEGICILFSNKIVKNYLIK
jgi:hypothetical protein